MTTMIRYVTPYGVPLDVEVPAEAAARPYVHGAECREAGSDPAWEVENLEPLVLSRWCGGRMCGVQQRWQRTAPPPPRPADDDPELLAFLAEHGRAHVEVRLELLDGDSYAHWVARCTHCPMPLRFRARAIAHYEAHGVEIGPRPRGPVTVADLVGSG
jgi:hypothetical protein